MRTWNIGRLAELWLGRTVEGGGPGVGIGADGKIDEGT
jgi:hypothetical protein